MFGAVGVRAAFVFGAVGVRAALVFGAVALRAAFVFGAVGLVAVLALRLGALAANRLISGFRAEMVGIDGTKLVSHPLNYVLSTERTIDPEKLLLAGVMAQ